MIRRILFVTRFISGGGAERVISVLANALTAQNYEVGIMVYNTTKEDYDLDKKIHCFALENYNENYGNSISRTVFRWKSLRKIIEKYHPDVLIPFLESAVRETFIVSRGLKIPIISAVRNMPVYQHKWEKYFYDYLYAHSDAVFLQTESQKQFFNQKIVDKSFVVPNPVNSVFIACGEKRKKRETLQSIVTAGRLSRQKNHHMLIQAMCMIHKEHPECSLEIYGEGEEYSNLKKFVEDLGAKNYIRLKGRNNHLEDIYENADVFVLSSDYEGMPNVLIEAMAAAMPCISTDCPTGPKELMGDSQRGRLVPVGDALKMAEIIMEIIESPREANQIGQEAHEYVKKHFSPEKVAKELIMSCEKYIRRKR